jgi:hypothetical protein
VKAVDACSALKKSVYLIENSLNAAASNIDSTLK